MASAPVWQGIPKVLSRRILKKKTGAAPVEYTNMTRIIAHSYPNGEVRAVICPDTSVRRDRPPAEPSELPLTLHPNSEPVKPGFGGTPRITRFGNNARRTLSRCSGVFDRDGIPPGEIVFLTGTLPGGTREAMDALAKWSSYAVDLLKSHISKMGIASAYSMYVWEHQKRGALHLHYAIHVPDEMLRSRLIDRFKSIWTHVIDAICVKSSVNLWLSEKGVNWAEKKEVIQADAQAVYKSVGSYLAKYLGKQAPYSTHKDAFGVPYLPPVRWWGCSRPLLSRMHQLTKRMTIERCSLYKIQSIRNSMLEILTYSANPVHTYFSRCRTSQVFVTYDQENAPQIFDAFECQLRGNRRCDNGGKLVECDASGSVIFNGNASDEKAKAGDVQLNSGPTNVGGVRGGTEDIPIQLGLLVGVY